METIKSVWQDWSAFKLQENSGLVYAISAKFIFGPHFFSDNVNQYNYLEVDQIFFWPKLLGTANYKKYYFHQDSATSHTAKRVQEWFQGKMADKFLNKKSCPPRSPDLNPADFVLWSYLKTAAYNSMPKRLKDLIANIKRDINKIPESFFEKFEKGAI